MVQNQISELEDNLASTILSYDSQVASLAASYQAELSQAALEASNLLALTELSFQLDSVSMLLDFENQLTDLASAHTTQINLLNAEDAIEDAKENLLYLLKKLIKEKSQRIILISQSLKSPIILLKEQSQSLDNLEIRLSQIIQNSLNSTKQDLKIASNFCIFSKD